MFELPKDEVIRVACIGKTRSGKTTMAAANARGKTWAIDSDKGFVRARRNMSFVTAETLFPTSRGTMVPFFILQEAEDVVYSKGIESIVVDSVTKIYGRHARPAVMAARWTAAERKKEGLNPHKAANLQDKADAIQVLTFLASYGVDIWYIWHEKTTVDMKTNKQGGLDTIVKDTISDEERNRLMTSIDIVLRFDYTRGGFCVTVDPDTRGFGSIKPNTGFTIFDKPGNFWQNMMPRLYNLIYTTFTGKDSAVAWGMKQLGKEDVVEVEAFYDQIKERTNPSSHSLMWVNWMLAIEEKVVNGNGQPAPIPEKPVIVKNERGKDTPVPEEPAAPPEPERAPDPVGEQESFEANVMNGPSEFEGSEIDSENSSTEAPTNAPTNAPNDYVYRDGSPVAEDDLEDFQEYAKRFSQGAYDEKTLRRAKDMNEDWN